MKLGNKHILYFILLVATTLRFYNYLQLPFTHDEFSALFRTRFESFSELIKYGVMVDGHPAGVQVFLYFWTMLFGTSEWVVKLPFVISGIGAVYLIYCIGKVWYNESVGLIAAAFLASLQFPVFYSSIARPYTGGLFFSLLMVHYWSLLIKKPTNAFNKNLTGFILSATLCAYTHHFSLLFAAIVGVSGIFFFQKQYLIKYLGSGIIIFLLYIPHLNIFLKQLSMGGVEEWLAKPQNDFFLDYIAYAFHYSYLVYIVVFGLIIYGYISRDNALFNYKKVTFVFFCWFIIPFLVGFFYSKYVNAILQFSVLLFTFPFLFFVLFSHFKSQKIITNCILVFVILGVNIFTLVHGRKHYTVTYKSPYQEILVDHQLVHKTYKSVFSILDSDRKITPYYNQKLDIDSNYTWFETFSTIKEFSEYLKTQSKTHQYLYLGAFSNNLPLTVPVILQHFPTLVWQHNYAGATSYLFSTKPNIKQEVFDQLDFESEASGNWSPIDNNWTIDSIKYGGKKAYLMNEHQEYSFAFTKSLSYLLTHENNFIDISLKVYSLDNYNDIALVASLDDKDGNIHWSATNFNTFISDTLEWTTVTHSIKMSDIPSIKNSVQLKVYIWNNGKRSFVVDDFTITVRDGNPIIYGILEEIDLEHF